ncbi:hypothetical protein DSO57_1002287 [Entomophthora muscae]|uniref:Uncharacterized protein n=1 Tax=Entomophthora muscae TaxID=34485 RepID=A0ACC2TK38_9FUNG|nr:hypothetical protein DSO57_1002287 [Entomophthora muscae]
MKFALVQKRDDRLTETYPSRPSPRHAELASLSFFWKVIQVTVYLESKLPKKSTLIY